MISIVVVLLKIVFMVYMCMCVVVLLEYLTTSCLSWVCLPALHTAKQLDMAQNEVRKLQVTMVTKLQDLEEVKFDYDE